MRAPEDPDQPRSPVRPCSSARGAARAPLEPATEALLRALPPGRTLVEERRIARRGGLAFVPSDHPEFPAALRDLSRPPAFLYRWGKAPVPAGPVLAIVGSRRASAAGERVAYRFARELSEEGWTIVSGLARGIDRAALEGAVAGGTGPLAVLGNGLPNIYPAEHTGLAEAIVSVGGAILSMFACHTPPRRSHFPRRNRWLSALARGVVIVEGTERSGSLITARWALEQGREVMAVPGPVEGPSHSGCHQLIRDGATLVRSPEDVREALEGGRPEPAEVPEALRRAFEAGEHDLARLLDRTGLPPVRLLEAWHRLIDESGAPPGAEGASDTSAGVS